MIAAIRGVVVVVVVVARISETPLSTTPPYVADVFFGNEGHHSMRMKATLTFAPLRDREFFEPSQDTRAFLSLRVLPRCTEAYTNELKRT